MPVLPWNTFASVGARLSLLVALCMAVNATVAGAKELPLHTLNLPPGFSISLYADDVPNARAMALSPGGVVFVGSRRAGRVYAVVDRDGDNKAETVLTIARGLNLPTGVAFRDGSLYVAEVSRILRYDDIEANLERRPRPSVVIDTLPNDRHHGWKFIAFGPDGLMYVPVGAPCNVCERNDDPRYSAILRMRPDGTELEPYAHGVRNSVGFDWHPETQELWFTDNGRDMLGDDIPSDELNHAPRPGLHFGFPYCHEGEIPDPVYGSVRPCADFESPVVKLGPHVAGLGMRFYTGSMFPETYRHQIFVAQHGSWNRTFPIGYRVMRVKLAGTQAEEYEVFVDGWLRGAQAWGRPVDVLVMPDGALLVSDDRAGVIYRISYDQ